MPQYKSIRRITVYAAVHMKDELIEEFLKLGSTGYTWAECNGKGEHPVVEGLLGPNSSHVRIELLVPPDVADKIMGYLEQYHHRNHSLAACVETVEVAKFEHY